MDEEPSSISFPTEFKDKLTLLVGLTATGESKLQAELLAQTILDDLISDTTEDGPASAETVSKYIMDDCRPATEECLVKILMRSDKNSDSPKQRPNFYNKLCGIVFELVGFNGETALRFVEGGIVRAIICIMESFSEDEFLLCTCQSVFSNMFPNLRPEKCIDLIQNTNLLESIVAPLERQAERGREQLGPNSAKLFWFTCHALGPSVNVFKAINWETRETEHLFSRIVHSVYCGILFHPADEDAQDVGRFLLRCLVGDRTALEMIDHAEMHHCEDADCSCAA